MATYSIKNVVGPSLNVNITNGAQEIENLIQLTVTNVSYANPVSIPLTTLASDLAYGTQITNVEGSYWVVGTPQVQYPIDCYPFLLSRDGFSTGLGWQVNNPQGTSVGNIPTLIVQPGASDANTFTGVLYITYNPNLEPILAPVAGPAYYAVTFLTSTDPTAGTMQAGYKELGLAALNRLQIDVWNVTSASYVTIPWAALGGALYNNIFRIFGTFVGPGAAQGTQYSASPSCAVQVYTSMSAGSPPLFGIMPTVITATGIRLATSLSAGDAGQTYFGRFFITWGTNGLIDALSPSFVSAYDPLTTCTDYVTGILTPQQSASPYPRGMEVVTFTGTQVPQIPTINPAALSTTWPPELRGQNGALGSLSGLYSSTLFTTGEQFPIGRMHFTIWSQLGILFTVSTLGLFSPMTGAFIHAAETPPCDCVAYFPAQDDRPTPTVYYACTGNSVITSYPILAQ